MKDLNKKALLLVAILALTSAAPVTFASGTALETFASGVADFLQTAFFGIPLWAWIIAFVIIIFVLDRFEYDVGFFKPLAEITTALLVVGVVIAVGVPFAAKFYAPSPAPTTQGIVLTKPLRITLRNPLTGAKYNSGTLSLYVPGSSSALESITFNAYYMDTSAYPEYKSGNSFNWYYVNSNTKKWGTFTAPYASSELDTFLPVTIDIIPFPSSHASFLQLPNGTTYSSDITDNGALLASNSKPTLHWEARITSDNTGFESYNVLVGGGDYPSRKAVLMLTVTVSAGNRPAISGMSKVYTDSSKDIYAVVIDSLKRVVDANGNVVDLGNVAVDITMDSTPMTSGATATLTMELYYHVSPEYLTAYGAVNSGYVNYDVVDAAIKKP